MIHDTRTAAINGLLREEAITLRNQLVHWGDLRDDAIRSGSADDEATASTEIARIKKRLDTIHTQID